MWLSLSVCGGDHVLLINSNLVFHAQSTVTVMSGRVKLKFSY